MAAEFTDDDVKISLGISEGLKKQKENSEFSDLVVVVGSSEFQCHRVIMSAVSGFFRGLLASGMKEAGEGKVILKGLSNEIFSQLLTCIYTGRSIITEANLFDVWTAADLLDVGFLLQQCFEFFKRLLSVDNCFIFCLNVRLLNEQAKQMALDFIIANFENVHFSEHLSILSFEDMKYIVASEMLIVSSEDDVIEAVLRWIECNHNLNKLHDVPSSDGDFSSEGTKSKDSPLKTDQDIGENMEAEFISPKNGSGKSDEEPPSYSEMLAELLECTRYLLISNNFLVHTLACHELIQDNPRCQAIVSRIHKFLAHNDLHQEWCPSAAVHRHSSAWKNVLIQFRWDGPSSYILTCFNPSDMGKRKDGKSLPKLYVHPHSLQSGVFFQNRCLYSLSSQPGIFFYSPISQNWMSISTDLQQTKFTILIAQSMYMVHENSEDEATSVSKISLHDGINHCPSSIKPQPVCQLMQKGLQVKGVTNIGNKLIVFWCGSEVRNFTIECYDLIRRKSTIIEDQLGSTADLITLRKDGEAFVLQENGALWRIYLCSSTNQLILSQECQLWDGYVKLKGALIFDSQLYIGGNDTNQVIPSLENVSLEGVFKNIIFYHLSGFSCERVAHAVLPRHILPEI